MTKLYTLKSIAVLFLVLYTSLASANGPAITPFNSSPDPAPHLSASLCGTVLPDMDGWIYADQFGTATAYRFKVTHGRSMKVVESADNTMLLKDVPFYAYNTTYSIEVSANEGGTWTGYGPACNVTTTAPVTQLSAWQCGTVLTDIEGEIYTDNVPTATAYRYKITQGSNTLVFETTENSMRLKDIPFYAYSTNYRVQVAAEVDGTWIAYGAACNVTTAAAVTQLASGLCGTVLTSMDGEIYSDGVPTATAFRFKVTHGRNVQVLESTETTVRLVDLTFYAYNTTYSVMVAAKVNGAWAAYGAACNVTTPAPVTQISADICGTVLTNMEGDIYSDNVPTATAFRFRITRGSNVQVVESPESAMRLKDISFYAYNATYSIQVAAKVNGAWAAYGAACNVTTPAPTTHLVASLCGTVLTNLEGDIYSDGVPTATAFRFRVTQGSNVQVLESAESEVRLMDVAFYAYNTTYTVDVAAKVNGAWTAYGTACDVTTPAPITHLVTSLCGTVLTSLEGEIYSDGVPTATAFRFRVTQGSNVQVLESTESTVLLKDITFFAYNTTYSVDVAAKVNGVWVAYGPACDVTTPAITLTITAAPKTRIYGATNPALTYTYTGFINDDTPASLTTQPVINTVAVRGSSAGSYPITISGAVAPGYSVVYVPAVLTVTPAPLKITVDNKTAVSGTTLPALTVSYTGFVNGDAQSDLTTRATATTTASASSAPGRYPITASGAQSSNYSITYAPGILTVIPSNNAAMANLSISSGSLSPAYNSSTFAYTGTVTYAVDNLVLTPSFDATAKATINGVPVSNGSPYKVALNAGDNTITTIITAQNGTTKNTYTITVYRGVQPNTIVPTNILSPNGDGKNDTWTIKDIQLYPKNVVTIYDKAGRSVYTKKGYTNDWDGTLNGAPLTQGTYYYTIYFGPGISTLKGFITIIKSR